MRSNASAVIDLLTRLYGEIHALESEYGLLLGGGDFRPRVEYFHDAVRALTSGFPRERLSLELLAYDARALRYLAAHPLSELRRSSTLSAETRPARIERGGMRAPRPNREVKTTLAERYTQYGALFCALFKPSADRDFRTRTDALDEEVETLSALAQSAEAHGSEALLQSAARIEDAGFRAQVIALIRQKKLREALLAMKEAMKRADRDIRQLDEAHGAYLMATLGLYETGKDMMKKLAGSGVNLAGRFVEQAMADAARDTSRGR